MLEALNLKNNAETRYRCQVSVYRTIGPLVYFSFYRPSRPNFVEIEKKRDFFQFYFFISLRLMPVQYWSSVLVFGFVFSIAARLIELPQVTAPGEILPF